MTCETFPGIISDLLEEFPTSTGDDHDRIDHDIRELKKWGKDCVGWEIPSRYADYPNYPTLYHPLTVDGEENLAETASDKITFRNDENLGFFWY